MSDYSVFSTVLCLSFISYSASFFRASPRVNVSTELSTITPMWVLFFKVSPSAKHISISLYLPLTDHLDAKKKNIKKTENMRSIISFRTCILSKGQIYFSVQKCTYQVTVVWFPSKETAKTYVSCLLTLVWSHPFFLYAILCICDVLWIDIQAEEMGKIENDLNLFSMKSHQLRGNRDYSNNSW